VAVLCPKRGVKSEPTHLADHSSACLHLKRVRWAHWSWGAWRLGFCQISSVVRQSWSRRIACFCRTTPSLPPQAGVLRFFKTCIAQRRRSTGRLSPSTRWPASCRIRSSPCEEIAAEKRCSLRGTIRADSPLIGQAWHALRPDQSRRWASCWMGFRNRI
jgi:hypothetical protein